MFSKRFNLTINNRIPAYKKIIEVDSDKSISIRSFLISAISQNKSIIKNVLESEKIKTRKLYSFRKGFGFT